MRPHSRCKRCKMFPRWLPRVSLVAVLIAGCQEPVGSKPANSGGASGGGGAGGVHAALGPSGGPSDADEVRKADISVLFVGNSHTQMHDLPGLVGTMIEFLRPGKTVYTHYLPVAYLEDLAR